MQCSGTLVEGGKLCARNCGVPARQVLRQRCKEWNWQAPWGIRIQILRHQTTIIDEVMESLETHKENDQMQYRKPTREFRQFFYDYKAYS